MDETRICDINTGGTSIFVSKMFIPKKTAYSRLFEHMDVPRCSMPPEMETPWIGLIFGEGPNSGTGRTLQTSGEELRPPPSAYLSHMPPEPSIWSFEQLEVIRLTSR